MRVSLFLLPLLLVACDEDPANDKSSSEDTGGETGVIDTGTGPDADGDGYGDDVDCNDANPEVNPGATEVCDGTDNDCDGAYDEEAADQVLSYTDADGDGYGVDGTDTLACPGKVGFAVVAGDCNDGTSTVNPGAAEYCNGVDDDCDSEIDEFSVDGTWYADNDRDGFGSTTAVIYDCVQPAGYIPTGGDCDDASALVYPGAAEWCDLADNDCNGTIDDNPTDGTPWYVDADGDGAGDSATADNFCSSPGDRVANGDDCDDGNISIYPDAPEICEDGIDNGCDGFDDCRPSGYLIPGDATVKLLGLSDREFAGSGLFVGDVNGDSHPDVLVGAYGYNPGSASSAGRIYALYGPFSGSESLSAPDATFSSASGEDYLGWAVSAGDADGDGVPDVIAGAYGEDSAGSGAGAAYLFASETGAMGEADALAMVTGDAAGDAAGWSVGAWEGGWIVGAPGHDGNGSGAGAVALFTRGSGSLLLSEGDALITGSAAADAAGYALSTGDVDGDGATDLLLGATGYGGAGAVGLFLDIAVLSGPFTLSDADVLLTGDGAGDQFGVSVAMGNLDGDGRDEILVGADLVDDGATDGGAAYVWLGTGIVSGTASAADVTRTGGSEGDYLGRSVVVVGDVDGDGANEFAAGGTSFDGSGSPGAGAMFLFYGPASGVSSALSAEAIFQGANSYDAMGHRAGAADLDGDGFDDLVSSAMGRDDNGTSSGGAFAWFGSVE